MHHFLLEIANPIGIVGVVLILVAYYYLSVGSWIADSMKFQFLNFMGAWMLLYSLIFYWNTASVVIEVVWIMISMVGMYRAMKLKKMSAE
jgi:hypothetical protein